MGRQMFRDGGIVPMQYGGMAPTDMPPQDMGMAPPPMAPQDMGMAPTDMPPQDMGMTGEDEQMLMAGLSGAQDMLGDLDAASNVEEAINAIRQDAAPLEARRDELAEFVGPEDAARTPDSVLLMLQPVIIMDQASAAGDPMDAGVGGLAAGAMDVPVEGPMAEGIMSTVNMNPGPEAPMEGPPVNFSLGGNAELEKILANNADVFSRLNASPEEIKAATEDARNTAEANILFDAAAAGLNLAAGPVPGGSVMQNLAAAFSPVLANVPGRAAPINALKNKYEERGYGVKLLELKTAQEQLAAERSARAEAQKTRDLIAGRAIQGDLNRASAEGQTGARIAGTALQGDLDRASTEGLALIRQANANVGPSKTVTVNGKAIHVGPLTNELYAELRKKYPGLTVTDTISSPQKTGINYLIRNKDGTPKVVLSFDGGRTYAVDTPNDSGGNTRIFAVMPAIGVKIGEANATAVASNARRITEAKQKLNEVEMDGVLEGSFILPENAEAFGTNGITTPTLREYDGSQPLNGQQRALIKNAFTAAQNSTGPYAAMEAGFSNLLGGAVPVASFQEGFVDNDQNRDFLRSLKIVVRGALVFNPGRISNQELTDVNVLFPDPDKFWRNPKSQAQKLVNLKDTLLNLNLEMYNILSKEGINATQVANAQNKQQKIQYALRLLGPVPSSSQIERSKVTSVGSDAIREKLMGSQ